MSPSFAASSLVHLTDAQLLDSLASVLRTQRRALAALVAHLGEVEERRLHLRAACSSMFVYCVERLGMSEDEACRRIDLARLARRFPALFAELESGQITLSVALVLKPVLSDANHLGLLAAARGKSMRQARELVASRFPRADVPSTIRKLPERPAPSAVAPPDCAPEAATRAMPVPAGVAPPDCASPAATPVSPAPAVITPSRPATGAAVSPAPLILSAPSPVAVPPRSRIEPLSAQRYRIQFTADAALKEKLERARALLRHAHPDGDFAPIVARALDLLLDELMRRRFGAGVRRAGSARAEPKSSRYVPHATRRSVLDRDGLGCSWVDEHGTRCGSRAWLELDHRHPAGKGGGSEADNVRLLCHAHNQWAAEQAYGRQHVEDARAARGTH